MTESHEAAQCRIETLADGVLAVLLGDIDFGNAPQVRVELAELVQHEPARLVLDLGRVAYLDSSGVGAIVEASQLQRRAGRKCVVCGLQPHVRGVFDVARLPRILTIVDSPEAACRV